MVCMRDIRLILVEFVGILWIRSDLQRLWSSEFVEKSVIFGVGGAGRDRVGAGSFQKDAGCACG